MKGVLEALLQALDAATTQPGSPLRRSVPFARALLTLLTHPGAGLQPPAGGGAAAAQHSTAARLLALAQRTSCFMTKTLVSKARALLG